MDTDGHTRDESMQELLPSEKQSVVNHRTCGFTNHIGLLNCLGSSSKSTRESLASPTEPGCSKDKSAPSLPPKRVQDKQFLHHVNYPPHGNTPVQEQGLLGSRTCRFSPAGVRHVSTNTIKQRIEANNQKLLTSTDNEDMWLAIVKQNEFLKRQLKATDDFIRTIEFEGDLLATRLAFDKHTNKSRNSHTDEEVDYSFRAVPQQHYTLGLQRVNDKVMFDRGSSENASPALTGMVCTSAMIVPNAVMPHKELYS